MAVHLNIKSKVIGLVLSVAFIISIIAYGVMFFFSKSISHDISNNILETSKNNIKSITGSIYNSCEIADQVLTSILVKKLNEAKLLIKKNGGINISNQNVEWQIVNQVTKETKSQVLPKMMIGNNWIGINNDFSNYQPIVDDLIEKNYTFTIFQRINDNGDMLRVATNVKLENGNRAIGTYIPSVNTDGTSNEIVQKVLNKQSYFGSAFVVNQYYHSVYEPITNSDGKIIGMLYSGVSMNEADKLRKSIIETKVGKSGYAYVLGGSGARRGYYIISKDGTRDGENIIDIKDADGNLFIVDLINQAKASSGDITFKRYKWRNSQDGEFDDKIVAIAYFKPFDWVIGAGTSMSEIEESAHIVEEGFSEIYIYLGITIILLLIAAIFTSSIIGEKISYPIKTTSQIMNDLAHGKIEVANAKIKDLSEWYGE